MKSDLISELSLIKVEANEMIAELLSLIPDENKINDQYSMLKIRMGRIRHLKARLLKQSVIKRRGI